MRSLAVMLACFALATVPSRLIAQQRKCDDMRNPKELPSLSALIDSARALAEFTAVGVPADGMVFSLLFNETDSLPFPRPLAAVGPRALGVLRRTLLPLKPVGLWAVRVRVVGGATPALTLERSEYCPPALAERTFAPVSPSVTVRADAPSDRRPTLKRPTRVVLEVLVAETGDASSIRVVQSSGLRDVDDELVRVWQTRRFLPASIDGVPLPALYRICIAQTGTHQACDLTTSP